eukprot:gb/GEZN01006133.1/.p1 GENE.gb/GEZN01006133.1/~~gb/GEZN01006133.1/.p1  ORF type:complete len:423 (-),score=83.85 gb/GEZN01006133.1/:409-1677(-)
MALAQLGSTLRKPDGSTIQTADALAGKEVLGLYFSAHWCPPCKGFTPVLGKKYKALLEAKKKIEIVFVSSDKDEDAFNDYHKVMPFLALPYDNREAKNKLSRMFKVQGIPTLVFIDAQSGNLLTLDGREAISEDDFIKAFPYRPIPVDVMGEIGGSLLKPDGSTVATNDALKGKTALGIYFSAHWCPPCRGFTPTLCQKVKQLKDAGKTVEFLFISSDRDENSFKEYHKSMNFLALPFDNRTAKNNLNKHFKVEGIPTLVFIDVATGALITDEGREAVMADTFLDDFPFHPKPVNDLSESLKGINDNVCLIAIMDKAPAAQQKKITEILFSIAEAEKKKPEAQQIVNKFFTGKTSEDCPLDKVKRGCGYEGIDGPMLLLLDLADEGAYYHPAKGEEEVTAANIASFMQAFKAGTLKKCTFGG